MPIIIYFNYLSLFHSSLLMVFSTLNWMNCWLRLWVKMDTLELKFVSPLNVPKWSSVPPRLKVSLETRVAVFVNWPLSFKSVSISLKDPLNFSPEKMEKPRSFRHCPIWKLEIQASSALLVRRLPGVIRYIMALWCQGGCSRHFR